MQEKFLGNHWALILDILENGRAQTWFQLSEKYQIKVEGTYSQRVKAANDIWRRFVRLTNKDNIDLTTIKQTLNKEGEVVFETKALRTESPDINPSILEGTRIKKITVNPYGKPWVTYEPDQPSISGLSKEDMLEAMKEVLADVEEKEVPEFNFKNTREGMFQKSILVYTSDKHIGAKTESNSIYTNEYNKEVFRNRMLQIANKIQTLGPAENLVIFDLGDALDGFNGQTTRGGHTLPQNMNNKEQFKTYLEIHKEFFEFIQNNGNRYNNVYFVAAANNNHGGDFDFMAMKSLEMYLNRVNPFIRTHVSERFIDHLEITVGGSKNTIIYTHGKDDKDMKHGLPLILNDKVENYINNYIDYHQIDARYPIHFVKGDLHQSATQYAKRFRYKNVGSIYGSSKWIHTNFGNTKPICDIDVIESGSINEIRLFL